MQGERLSLAHHLKMLNSRIMWQIVWESRVILCRWSTPLINRWLRTLNVWSWVRNYCVWMQTIKRCCRKSIVALCRHGSRSTRNCWSCSYVQRISVSVLSTACFLHHRFQRRQSLSYSDSSWRMLATLTLGNILCFVAMEWLPMRICLLLHLVLFSGTKMEQVGVNFGSLWLRYILWWTSVMWPSSPTRTKGKWMQLRSGFLKPGTSIVPIIVKEISSRIVVVEEGR